MPIGRVATRTTLGAGKYAFFKFDYPGGDAGYKINIAATPDDANETIRVIRTALRELYGEAAAQTIRIEYGGSVKPGNAAELMAQPEIDGALVGGASLDPDDFARIVQYRR